MKKKIHYPTHEEIKQKLFAKDPELKKLYKESQAEFDLTCLIIDARLAKGITQQKLAQKLGTKQAVISRIEGGANTSVNFLRRIAAALDVDLQVKFVPRS